jgi:hypothetical protein
MILARPKKYKGYEPMDHSSETKPLVVIRGRLSKEQLFRLNALYDMDYTPRELADEVGFTRRQVYRVYLPLGCPHKKDHSGYVTINGRAFKEWYRRTYARRSLLPGESFCLTCKRAVPIINPEVVEKKGMEIIQSNCPNCGRPLARFRANHWNNNTIKNLKIQAGQL